MPSILAFNIGPMTVLTRVWPVLKSLPHTGTPWSLASFSMAGMSTVRLGAPLINGTPSIKRRVGVDHRGGDVLIVVVQAANKAFYVLMDLGLCNEFFGRGAPDHDQPVATVVLFEAPDVVTNGLHEGKLGARNLSIGAVDSPYVIVVEHCRHWSDRLHEIGYGLQLFVTVQNAGLSRRFVGVVGDRVPRSEYQLVEFCQRGEVTYERSPLFGTLSQADGGHLGNRAERPPRPAPDVLDAGNKRGRHRPQTNQQDAKFAACRLHAGRVCRNKVPWVPG